MIWDKLEQNTWPTAAPYVDTALVPVFDLGTVSKDSYHTFHTNSVEDAKEIEQNLTGRVLLMPAIGYTANEEILQSYVTSVRRHLLATGFLYVFFVVDPQLSDEFGAIDWGDTLHAHKRERGVKSEDEIQQLCEQIIQKWQAEA